MNYFLSKNNLRLILLVAGCRAGLDLASNKLMIALTPHFFSITQ